MRLYLMLILSIVFTSSVLAETVPPNATETSWSETNTIIHESTPIVTSTEIVNASCEQYNTCETCLQNKECYFCQEDNKCQLYVLKDILPNKQCHLKDVYFETCTISLLVTIILISIAGAIVLLGLVVCCCCCCCRGENRFKLSKDDLKWARQREERRMKAEEKRKERSARTEEIRRKYGLFKGETPYQRFDA